MKVEAVVLKPMRAGDGKQGIKFAWPKACIHSAKQLVAFLADSLRGRQSLSEAVAIVCCVLLLPLSLHLGGSADDISAVTSKGYSFVIGRFVSPVLVRITAVLTKLSPPVIKPLMTANLQLILGLSSCISTTSPTLTL